MRYMAIKNGPAVVHNAAMLLYGENGWYNTAIGNDALMFERW